MIRFVIPAYNEAENIPRLLADLAPVARELGARVIIVDDGSTDGTARRDPRTRPRHAPGDRHPHDQPRPGDGDQHRHPLGPQGVLRRRRDRHARGRHDLRSLRPAADARALRPGHRRRARLGLRAGRQDRRRRRLAPGGEQIGLQHLPLPGRAARDAHALLALPRLPRRDAAPRRRYLRLPAGPRARLRRQRRAAAEALQRRRHASPRCRRRTTGRPAKASRRCS